MGSRSQPLGSAKLNTSTEIARKVPEARPWSLVALLVAILFTTGIRLWLLFNSLVPFNSDEAIVGLMARHILDGARPIFFYGQAYMGSLDAWLIAASFRLIGEGLIGIRVVQIALYVAFLVTTWLVARRFYGREVAAWAVLLASLPPVLVLTYTSATLGGYGETLFLGNLVLLFGYRTLSSGIQAGNLEYGLLGLIGGLAYWTLGIAGVYLAPVAILHLTSFSKAKLTKYSLGLLGFAVTSSPWWLANFRLGGEAMAALTTGYPITSSVWQRLLGLVALGIPALLGLRFPWSPTYVSLPLIFLGTILHAGIIAHSIHRWRTGKTGLSLGSRLLLIMGAVFLAAFLGTQFGIDSTGRYLLPLYLPLVLAGGHFIRSASEWRKGAGYLVLGAFMLSSLAGVKQAIESGDGLTTQFDPISRFDNAHDDLLVRFLQAEGYATGYSNYWVAYRLAFLTDEAITLAPALPYKDHLSYTPRDDRIEGYRQAADSSDRVVYITTLHPRLDGLLRDGFVSAGAEFRETQMGPYHVFYDLDKAVRPERFGFGEESP
jgi:4-amino-4-deoxy-L-arabinose transferase-like glycosyltransferase